LRTTPASLASVYINIVNIVSDAAGMGTMSHRLIRIFPTTPVLRFGGVIHECLMRTDDGELEAVLSPITIIHKGYTHEMLAAREKDARNKPLIAQAYEEHGDDSFALFNYGNSAICSGNTELGIEVLERMLATAPVIKLYFPLVYLLLGQAYCESLGEHQRALDILDTGLETFPNDAGILFTKGQVLVRLNRIEDGRALFEQALSMREHMVYTVMTDEEIFEWKVHYALAGTYERENKFDLAIECIDRALANKPQAFHLQRAKASFLERNKRYYDAEIAFRKLAESDRQRGQVELVNYLLRRSRFSQAIAIVENEANPETNGDLVAMLSVSAARATMQSGSGDPLPFLETALRRAPGHGPAIALMEQLLTERGDLLALERLHREELLATCKFPEDFARRSFRMLALNRFDDALAAADTGLQIDPRNAELRFNKALAALRLGDEKQAAHEFSRVEPSAPPVYAAAMRLRALLLSKHGDRAGALAALKERIATFPSDADAIVESARILWEAGAHNDAIGILEASAEVDSRVALELARMMLQSAVNVGGAGPVAHATLR
jgi:tetratricopeptide (TPR) repeat protein